MSGLGDSPLPLFAAFGLALAAAGWTARHTAHNVEPWDADTTWTPIRVFYADRHGEPADDVELGDGWTSTRDPGAAFAVSWIAETEELVLFRHQAKATMRYSPVGVFGLATVPTMNRRAEGMKVLTRAHLRTLLATRPETMRTRPDGLDQLARSLGTTFEPPPAPAGARGGPAKPARVPSPARPAGEAERHERLVSAIPTLAAAVGLILLVTVAVAGSQSGGSPAGPFLLALGALLAAGALIVTGTHLLYSRTLARRTDRVHREARHARRGAARHLEPRAHRRPAGPESR